MRRISTTALIAALAACGGDNDAAEPGGNVSFGGAQDIGQFRNILDAGGIPGEQTLDANGFFNEHYIELPAPDCGQVMCGHAMFALGRDWLYGDYRPALQIALNTPIDPTTLERLPLNLVVVVDTSGSMASDQRLVYVKDGLHLLIDELEPGDRLAVVEYNSDVRVIAELDGVQDRAALHGLVSTLVPSGSTDLYGGLQTGLALAAASWDGARQNRVMLLSDGLPTVGVQDEGSIIAMASDYISDGIGLTTIGVGLEFNTTLMQGLAERGAGNFYFLEDARAIDEVFTEELDTFVTPLALDIDITLRTAPGYVATDVVGTRLWSSEPGGGSIHIPAAFIASRVSAAPTPNGRRGGGSTLFVSLDTAGGSTFAGDVAQVVLSYRLPDSAERVQQTLDVTYPGDPAAPAGELYVSHQAMAKNFAVYNLFRALREATRHAQWSYSCALAVLEVTDAQAARWNAEYEDPDIAADRGLIAQFERNLRNQGAWVSDGEAGDWIASCEDGYYPYGDDVYYDDDIYYCSAAGTGAGTSASTLAGALVIALGMWLAARRRRTCSAESRSQQDRR